MTAIVEGIDSVRGEYPLERRCKLDPGVLRDCDYHYG